MAEDLRIAKRRRITDTAIMVVVRTELFLVHEKILSEHSTFFKAAIADRWRQGRNGKVYLPDDDSTVVGAYFDWLYSSKIASKPEKSAAQLEDGDINAEFEFLSHLYVFGEKVSHDEFCNAVTCAIVEKVDEDDSGSHCYPGEKAVRILYEGTAAGSPARKFMVNFTMQFRGAEWADEDRDGRNSEFWRDVAKEFLSKRRQSEHVELWENRHWFFK